jgi:hypothetical protein
MRARYGASPLHLLAHLACFALVAWALLRWLDLGGRERILLWLAGAVVLHDALLWPAYTLLDRLARRGRPRGWANYVRVPVGVSAYARVSGTAWEGYAARWLLVSAALFAGAGALYLLRARSGSSS